MALTPFPSDPLAAVEGIQTALSLYRSGQLTVKRETAANALWNVIGFATGKTLEDDPSVGPFGASAGIQSDADAIEAFERAAVGLDPNAAPFAASGAVTVPPIPWRLVLSAAWWLMRKLALIPIP